MKTHIPLSDSDIKLLLKALMCYRKKSGAVECTLQELMDLDRGKPHSKFIMADEKIKATDRMIDLLRIFL